MNRTSRFFSQLIKNQKLYSPLLAALLTNALAWFLIIWRLPVSANWIPLHYNVLFGIDWIGPWIKITQYPLLSLLVLAVNLFLASWINESQPRIASLLIWSALIVQLVVIFSLILLIINYFG